jgi:hypothetical protein
MQVLTYISGLCKAAVTVSVVHCQAHVKQYKCTAGRLTVLSAPVALPQLPACHCVFLACRRTACVQVEQAAAATVMSQMSGNM